MTLALNAQEVMDYLAEVFPQVRDDLPKRSQAIAASNVDHRLKGDVGDARVEPVIRSCVEIYDRRKCATHWGELREIRSGLGFIGHDGNPWVWEASKECWLPIMESSRADAYASAKTCAPPA